jgi:hypothetical protein
LSSSSACFFAQPDHEAVEQTGLICWLEIIPHLLDREPRRCGCKCFPQAALTCFARRHHANCAVAPGPRGRLVSELIDALDLIGRFLREFGCEPRFLGVESGRQFRSALHQGLSFGQRGLSAAGVLTDRAGAGFEKVSDLPSPEALYDPDEQPEIDYVKDERGPTAAPFRGLGGETRRRSQ